MPHSRSEGTGGYWLAAIQTLFAACLVAGLVAAPPASGRILLVPVGAAGRDGLARLAIDAGARLVETGPVAGSLVVTGNSGPLMRALLPRHVLVLRADIAGCGSRGTEND